MTDETQPLLGGTAGHATSQYRYSGLPEGKKYTRILDLQPGHESDHLKGTLRKCSLGWRTTHYQALSYCWGDASEPTSDHVLYIDGKELRITANAYGALQHSRCREHVVHLWLDQVCINQADLAERSQQINLMGLVFGKAAEVVVYLGEDFEGAELLFDFMQAVADDAEGSSGLFAWLRRRRRVQLPLDSPLRLIMRDGGLSPLLMDRLSVHAHEVPEFRNALFKLLSLPWFGRMWIVQEAALAQMLTVRLGDLSVNWNGLNGVVSDMPYHDHKKLGLIPRESITGFKSVCAIELLIREVRRPLPWLEVRRGLTSLIRKGKESLSWKTSREAMRLLRRRRVIPVLNLLREFRHQLATDECDKLFGIFGLATRHDLDDSYLSRISGKQGIVKCCAHFALMHILYTETLDILSAACSWTYAHESLPFWCPDWSQKTPDCDTKYSLGTYSLPPHHAWLDSTPAKLGMLEVDSNWPLVIEGFQIDEVSAVVTETFDVSNFEDPMAPLWIEWKAFAMSDSVTSPYDTVDDRRDAYWRTLIYNSDGREGFAPASLGETLKPFLENDSSCTDEVRQAFGGRFTWKSRKLYRTKRGYLGNGCHDVLPGDKVFICHGGRFPLLLREDKVVSGTMLPLDCGWGSDRAEYTLMAHKLIGGDTYVHGLCEGEGLDIAASEDLGPGMEIDKAAGEKVLSIKILPTTDAMILSIMNRI